MSASPKPNEEIPPENSVNEKPAPASENLKSLIQLEEAPTPLTSKEIEGNPDGTQPVEQQKNAVAEKSAESRSRLDQLLQQFLSYESGLSMTDYIKRFYVSTVL
ncbi:unnamed protein product [Nippostrongylus brasiliensis]|uniref:Flagellar motor switch protein FliN n=1 Tax=Nippostrongylus brasiliensis TaxID=27835 RepID=A0A0N4XMC5_NIPBR|nr:unnamed protein product [Nippostrongylus brasiliensis]